MQVIVENPNTIVIDVDQGRQGRGIQNITYTEVSGQYFLIVTYTDGTTETLGPLVVTGGAAFLLGGATGSIPYQSAPNTTVFLPIGTQNQVVVAGATVPQYTSALTGLTVNNSAIGNTAPSTGAFTNLSASGTFALTGDQVQISEGGTGQTTANGAFNALAPSQTGNAGKYLKTDGTNASWDQLDISTADITGVLPVANGGTGASTAPGARANLSAAILGANNDITSMTGLTGGISTPDFVQFDTTATEANAVGKVYWDQNQGTLDLGLLGGNVVSRIGQSLVAYVTNAEAVTITKGQVVYLFGAQGDRATVKLAYNTSDATSAKTFGVVAENIGPNQTGFVMCQGVLEGLNLAAFTAGDTLYLGATPGSLTATKPAAPNHLVYVGLVERANAGNGQLYVKVQNGYELDEIHDVQIVSPQNGQTILYDASTSLWKNANLTAGTGVSVTNGPASVTIGNTGVLSFSGGTTGLTPATSTTGVVTLGGTLAIGSGGTGQTTANASFNALAPSQTGNAGKYLKTDGTNSSWDLLDISTSDITGTLPVANGGTGATTAAGALTNLNAASQSTTISAGTGLTGGGDLSANRTLSIANTTVTAGAYGSASDTLTATVNAQGQLTALAATPIAIANTQISGLGTMSTQNASSVSITGGTITGITDLAVADGGTGASDAPTARSNLGAAASAITISAGTGLSGGGDLTANRTLSIANTTVTAASYGSASSVGTFTVNAQGQLTAAASTPIAIANTQVSGLGTMSTQNSNSVTIIGGSITGITDLAIADGGTGASDAPTARTNLGLGTSATLNAGVALGVATLDAGGTVPLSQLPASIQGGVSYQGSWDAATNTPTIVSSVGTKGYYYVVSVAGSTNINGISDWLPGDWIIFNGSIWQKIDNTDAVASVNGYTGVVVLSAADVGAPPTARTITAGTGLTGGGDLSANRTISIANTTVAAGSYGSASSVGTFTVNGQGQLTAAASTPIAITNTQVSGLGTMSTQNAGSVAITGGTIDGTTIGGTTRAAGSFTTLTLTNALSVANGGTGTTTSTGTGSVVLSSSPTLTTPNLGTPSAATLTNATGLPLTTGVTGTLPIGNGGTGQTTANAAFNALAPSQTGNAGKYLTTDGTNTSWATNPLGTVTSVDVSGGTTGLTTSGGPITSSGTITLGGTLATTNGGTGLTSFTANGVLYASSSSALTTGSALTFDGTTLGATALSVTGNTTLGDASGDTLTINGTAVSIPNGLNFDSNLLVLDATNNYVGINRSTPVYPLDVNGVIRAAFPNPDVNGIILQATTVTNAAAAQIINGAGNFYYGLDTSTGNRMLGAGSTGGYQGVINVESNYPLILAQNNTGRLYLLSGEAVFNEPGADYDFRVESDTKTHMFFVDASANTVGINNNNPLQPLDVTGNIGLQNVAGATYVSNIDYPIIFSSEDTGSIGFNGHLVLQPRGSAAGKVILASGQGAAAMKGRVQVGTTETVVNEDGDDYDFRIESDTRANMFVVDASANAIGINISNPIGPLFEIRSDRTNGTSANALTLSDAVTGTQTAGKGNQIVWYSNNYATYAALAFEVGSDGTNNQSQISLYTQATAGGSSRKLVVGATGELIATPIAGIGAVFNEDGVDADFRVESDANTHALFVDAGNSRIGINQSAPLADLHVGAETGISSAVQKQFLIIGGTYSTSSTTSNQYQVMSFIGTTAYSTDIFTHTTGESQKNFYLGQVTDNPYFNTNRFALIQGGVERMTWYGYTSPSVVINESGADSDFRVESDTNTHALFVDAGNSRVGINNSSPAATLSVTGVPRITSPNFSFATVDKEVDSSTGIVDFTFAEITGSGTSDNLTAVVIISIYQPSTSTTNEAAGYVGLRLVPRGGSGTLVQIASQQGSGISTFTVAANGDGIRVTTDTSPTLRCRLITLGGGGTSVPSE